MNENANLNNTEMDTPVELTAGEMLRNARTTGRRKREIQTISKQLCIREEFLQALEDGDYSAIPEQVYILGFARNYAMELGLNPDEIVAKIKKEMGIVSDVAPAAPADSITVGAVSWAGMFKRMVGFLRRKWKLVAVAVAILLVLIVVIAGVFGGGSESQTDGVADAENVATVQTVPEPKFAKSVRERFGAENRNSARIILQSVHESWVKIEDGRGNTVFSRVLVPGDVYYVPNGNGYKATFGNAGGIDIWVDGVSAGKAGPAHTRKSGVEMSADTLRKTAGTANKSDDEEQSEEAASTAE